jgi:predicted nucleic acid-binding protein
VTFLVDTCALSELTRPAPDVGLEDWFARTDEASIFASVLTIGELRKGIVRLRVSRRRAELETWLYDVVRSMSDRLTPISLPVAERWAELSIDAEKRGRPVAVADALIGATALCLDYVVVTRNVGDFTPLGVRVLNPWSR